MSILLFQQIIRWLQSMEFLAVILLRFDYLPIGLKPYKISQR